MIDSYSSTFLKIPVLVSGPCTNYVYDYSLNFSAATIIGMLCLVLVFLWTF